VSTALKKEVLELEDYTGAPEKWMPGTLDVGDSELSLVVTVFCRVLVSIL
jgi:hypothetical protein